MIWVNKYIVIFLILFAISGYCIAECSDFEIDGTYEASMDIPRIYFLLKDSPEGPPRLVDGVFELNYGYLDTGASGILMSRETADTMQIATDANGVFVDTGIGGDEFFDVSEPLYIGTLDFESEDAENPDAYHVYSQWRFQVSREYVEWPNEPLDVLGIPVMAGRTAILKPISDFNIFDDSGDSSGSMYFTADIKDSNDPNIPATDFQVALRFEKYINPSNPLNIPPLPVQAYNPVIDNITVEYNGLSSTGNYLFDSGAMTSIISVAQGMALGLVDANGDPIAEADFWIPIGGIGGEVDLPGFILDKLSVPTLNGFNLVFLNARVCVHDIGILDERSGEFIVLDGVFGDNFICASMNIDTWDISSTPFDNIVIDTRRGLLGFDVNSAYPVPQCVYAGCGSESNPRPAADLTHDCVVNIYDLEILAAEWLNTCNWLNFNCRGGDFDRDGILNFKDFAVFANGW
jgi:hypothetical protein